MTNPNKNAYRKFFNDKSPKNLLDVGANTGQFVKMWKDIFPQCKTLSIEANPYSAKKLQKLNIPYLNIGISDKKGTLELISNTKKPASKGASFYKEINYNKFTENQLLKIEVPVDTLDNLFSNQIFDVIKIDVQGAELDVVRGGFKTLLAADYIIIEVSIKPYNENAPLAFEVVKALEEKNIFIEQVLEEHTINDQIVQLDLLFQKREYHNIEHLNTKNYKADLVK